MPMKKVTQESWIEAVIAGWQKDWSIAATMLYASNPVTNESIKVLDWKAFQEEVSHFRPKLKSHVYGLGKLRVWIANNFMHANDAFWDKKPELAKQWLLSGKDRARIPPKKPMFPKSEGVKHAIKFRERDDTTAWNKVK